MLPVSAREFIVYEDDRDAAWADCRRLAEMLKKRGIAGVLLGVSPTAGGFGVYAYGKPSSRDANRFLASIVNTQA